MMVDVERINEKLRYVSVITAVAWIVWNYYSTPGLAYAMLPISFGVILLIVLFLSIFRSHIKRKRA